MDWKAHNSIFYQCNLMRKWFKYLDFCKHTAAMDSLLLNTFNTEQTL